MIFGVIKKIYLKGTWIRVFTFLASTTLLLQSCNYSGKNKETEKPVFDHDRVTTDAVKLDTSLLIKLLDLPVGCVQQEMPYKSGIILTGEEDLKMPIEHHPIFYGCFDWHSAVHGHWSLIYLMKINEGISKRQDIRDIFNSHITTENVNIELAYFKANKYNKSFERTYGWAWLLKLQEELFTWEDTDAKRWYQILKPLADYISQGYQEYLPKLVYPIRVGEHTNTAFGLSFAYDYAQVVGDHELQETIKEAAIRFYEGDQGCPITWEPSGYDFLSPCLQEMDIMRKVLEDGAYSAWLKKFLPSLTKHELELLPGEIRDRSDGKLVHLDGLNFSRAWCLFPIKNNKRAHDIANLHFTHSIKKIFDGDYAGQHWLGSFALYAHKMGQ